MSFGKFLLYFILALLFIEFGLPLLGFLLSLVFILLVAIVGVGGFIITILAIGFSIYFIIKIIKSIM